MKKPAKLKKGKMPKIGDLVECQLEIQLTGWRKGTAKKLLVRLEGVFHTMSDGKRISVIGQPLDYLVSANKNPELRDKVVIEGIWQEVKGISE